MSLKYLNENSIFKCTCGINAKFRASSKKIIKINKKSILTMSSSIIPIGIGKCRNKPNPEVPGDFLPCTFSGGKWVNYSSKIKNKSEGILTEDSSINCVFGGILKLDKISIKEINVVKNNNILNSIPNNSKKSNNSKEESLIKENNEKKDLENKKNYMELETFALCSLACENPEECEYINASIEVNNDADKLFKNYSDDKNKKIIKKSNCTIIMAAHHIIPGNEVLKKHKGLVKLANIYGYDINNKNNCKLLPCKIKTDDMSEKLTAFDGMSITKKQWHSGPHKYNIDKINFADKAITGEILNYEEAVNKELNKLEDYLKASNLCFSKQFSNIKFKKNVSIPKKYDKTQFKNKMNYRSKKIKEKIDSFEKNPKLSNPFYVSAVAYQYAFSIPVSKKFIIVYKEDEEIIFNKYKFVIRNRKDNQSIKFIEMIDTKKYKKFNKAIFLKIIEFCENINNFLVDKDIEIRKIFKVNNLMNISSSKEMIDSLNKNNNIKKIEAFLEKDDLTYIYPKKMIEIRCKELNLYLRDKIGG